MTPRPTVRDLASLVRAPATANDLVELTRLDGPARKDRDEEGRARRRRSARARSRRPSRRWTRRPPSSASPGPYAVDLTGWFDDFSHSGIYDALGGASRAAPVRQRLHEPQRRPEADPRSHRRQRGLQGGRVARTSATAARARWSGVRSGIRRPAPVTRPRFRWAREARARHPRRGAARRRTGHRRRRRGRLVLGRHEVRGRARQRLRPHRGRRPEGRRSARRQDHRPQARAGQPRDRATSRSRRPASARCAPTRAARRGRSRSSASTSWTASPGPRRSS